MFSLQHQQSQFFEIKYFIDVYGYDRYTKNCKLPVYELFTQKFDMLNPSQETVGDIINYIMKLKPAVFSGVKDSPDKYLFHLVLPPVAYPCNPAAIKVAEVVNRYKTVNPSSNSMIITVNIVEKKVEA